MDFVFRMAIFVLSVSLVAESVPQGLNNFDPFLFHEDFLRSDLAMEMSELHPVFYHSSSPQKGFVQNFKRGQTIREEHSNTETQASSSPELTFGFLPVNPKPSRYNHRQETGQKVSSFNRGQETVPRGQKVPAGPVKLYSHSRIHSPQRNFDPKPEFTHQTLGPNFLKLGDSGLVSVKSRFETDSGAQRFGSDSRNVRDERENSFHRSNQYSTLDHGSESVRSPTRHEDENTFSHYYRSFDRNSPPRYQNSPNTRLNKQGRNNNNLRSQRPDQTYIVRDNPTYTQPDVSFKHHSPEGSVHQNYHDIREKASHNPNNPSHNPPNPGHRKRTILLLKTPSLVTTERPNSAPFNPRGFRTRPQHHVPQQSEIEHSPKPRLHSDPIPSVRKPSVMTFSRNRVKHVDFLVSAAANSSLGNGRRTAEPSGLEAQHSHRLEQSDRNLYYKNDPFLDITEVYSHRPGFFDPIENNSKSKNKNLPDSTSEKTNIPDIKVSKSSTVENKNIPVIEDSKSSTFENKIHPQKSKSIASNRTRSLQGPVSYSSSVSMVVNRKKDKSSRKMTLKKSMSMRKKSKESVEEPSSVPGKPGSDYPTYQEIPPTKFDCRDVKSSGYYADMETDCQVFHNCDTDKQKHSFLCPNGTIFRQELFICDWWYNVKCEDAWDFFPITDGLHVTPDNN